MIKTVCLLRPDSRPPKFDVVWWEDVKKFWKTESVLKARQFESYQEALEFYKIMKAKENQK